MSDDRILALLDQVDEACKRASSYIVGFDRARFLEDPRTQQAVAMNLVIIGEALSRLQARHPEFLIHFPDLPLQGIRGMRNRIVHGYFGLDLEVVFDTVSTAIPMLAGQLPAMFAAAAIPSRDKT